MSDWISVEDELPKPWQTVIIKGLNYITTVNGICVGQYLTKYKCGKPRERNVWRNYLGGDTTIDGVTHWMPLPEPPK